MQTILEILRPVRRHQVRRSFGEKSITDITSAMVSEDRDSRRASISGRNVPSALAMCNRELAEMRRMYTVALHGLIALKGGATTSNPVASIPVERARDERYGVLSAGEFTHVHDAAETRLTHLLLISYYTGIRQREIGSLREQQIDLKASLLRLQPGDTKTREGRMVALNQTLTALPKSATRYVNCSLAFPTTLELGGTHPRYKGSGSGRACVRASQKLGVQDVTFHDLRHSVVTTASASVSMPLP